MDITTNALLAKLVKFETILLPDAGNDVNKLSTTSDTLGQQPPVHVLTRTEIAARPMLAELAQSLSQGLPQLRLMVARRPDGVLLLTACPKAIPAPTLFWLAERRGVIPRCADGTPGEMPVTGCGDVTGQGSTRTNTAQRVCHVPVSKHCTAKANQAKGNQRMFLPDWIYRMVPFVYIAVGLIVASHESSSIVVSSGALLVMAGLLVWKMRIDYRRDRRSTAATIRRKTRSATPR